MWRLFSVWLTFHHMLLHLVVNGHVMGDDEKTWWVWADAFFYFQSNLFPAHLQLRIFLFPVKFISCTLATTHFFILGLTRKQSLLMHEFSFPIFSLRDFFSGWRSFGKSYGLWWNRSLCTGWWYLLCSVILSRLPYNTIVNRNGSRTS